MELNKAQIIVSILKKSNGNDFFSDKDNVLIVILLLNRYGCIDRKVLKDINIDTNRKIKLYLEKAEQKILVNTTFRNKYFNIEENISMII